MRSILVDSSVFLAVGAHCNHRHNDYRREDCDTCIITIRHEAFQACGRGNVVPAVMGPPGMQGCEVEVTCGIRRFSSRRCVLIFPLLLSFMIGG